MVLHAIKKNFRCAEAFLLPTGRFFLLLFFFFKKYSLCTDVHVCTQATKIETCRQQNQQSSDKLEIPCGTKFLRVLIFAIFTIFPAIRKIKFPKKN